MTIYYRHDLGPWIFDGSAPDMADVFLAKLNAGIGAAATGTITCATKANLADSDYITIGNGVGVPVKYEFDTAGDGVTSGRTAVSVAAATTAASVAVILAAAITAAQPCFTVLDNLDGTITLTNKLIGTIGNVTMTENVAHASFTVSGMTGGRNP